MATNFKAPPAMRDDLPYSEWKKELKIWCDFTDVDKKKQGGALFLTLSGKARQSVLSEIDTDKLATDNGIKLITDALDKLYLKDVSQAGFTAFDEFIKYRRPQETSINDYLLEFNLKYNKIKTFNMVLPEGVLAYAVLTCANLPKAQEQICRATVNKLTDAEMKLQIEKVVLCQTKDESIVEPQFYNNNEDNFCEDDQYYEQPWQQDEQYTEDNSQYNDTYYAHQQHRSVPPNYQKHEHSRTSRLNPMDDYGKPAPCRFCHSIYHWVDKCPDAPQSAKTQSRYTRRPYRGRGRGNYAGNRQYRPL